MIKNQLPNKISKELLSELKKVSWPTKNDTFKLTAIVVIISLLIGFYIGIIDTLLAYALESFTGSM
jgi:preprotein translocase subunit SecE